MPNLNRRQFLAAAAPAALSAQAPKRPNVIFILADDLGWGDLGCYGNRDIQTPNLNRLASEGTLYTQFYTSNPVCSPSRTGFMTGQYPARHRIHGHIATDEQNALRGMPNWLDPKVPFLARTLKQAGYATAHFGKWHLGNTKNAPSPTEYGFDTHRTVNAKSPSPTWEDSASPNFRARSTAAIVDEAIAFIEKNRNGNFYINLWTLVPHAILNPTAEQMAPYKRFAPAGNIPHQGAKQIFYASVTDLDNEIGRLMSKLKELGLEQDTIVVFSSDNGPEDIHITNASHSAIGSPGPFRGRKRSLYEGGVRVPFLVRYPARVPAKRIDDQSVITAVDFFPTITKLAGVPAPANHAFDGEDRGNVLTGPPAPRKKPIHWEWRFNVAGYAYNRSPILSVRDGNWKLLLNPDRSRVELYDIPNDHMELTNLADKQPQVVKRLSEMALAWQKTLPPGPMDPEAGRNNWPMPK